MGDYNFKGDVDTIIFDIDGTLADCEHRRRHVRDGNKDWKRFNAEMHLDTPSEDISRLARLFNTSGYRIVLCTGREEDFRAVTVEWLRLHCVPYQALYMRPSKDYRSDDLVKIEMLAKLRADGFRPWLVVDDRNSVVAMWRAQGLTCLQCAPGDF